MIGPEAWRASQGKAQEQCKKGKSLANDCFALGSVLSSCMFANLERNSLHEAMRKISNMFDIVPIALIGTCLVKMFPQRIRKQLSKLVRGVARIFQRRGSYCVKVRVFSPDCHNGQGIVMAFSPPVVGSLIKKGLAKGGVTGTAGPPLATPLLSLEALCLAFFLAFVKASRTIHRARCKIMATRYYDIANFVPGDLQ